LANLPLATHKFFINCDQRLSFRQARRTYAAGLNTMGAQWQTEPDKTQAAAEQPDTPALPKRPRRRYGWWLFGLLVLGALVLLGLAIAREMHTSRLQAREFSQFAATLSYSMHKGPSDAVIYPGEGPFDKRLGYSALGEFLPRLFKRDYVIVEQARFSPALMNYVQHGFFVPYAEKIQAGLSITDCKGDALYQFHYPQHLYPDFASIPPVIVHSLLFIENRDLLDPADPRSNPAVDWPRFAMAAYSQVAKHLALPGQSAGGSTLATQLEKYRHSPDGLTVSGSEKLRQMISASVRAYQDGPQTLGARQRIVRDYLNSVPLSAVPGHGEVHGMAEGLRVWYGADFAEVNKTLASTDSDPASLAARGLALRQVLSLMIAQRTGHPHRQPRAPAGRQQHHRPPAGRCRAGKQGGVPRLGGTADHRAHRHQQGHQRGSQPLVVGAGAPAVRPGPPRPVGHQHAAGRPAGAGQRVPQEPRRPGLCGADGADWRTPADPHQHHPGALQLHPAGTHRRRLAGTGTDRQHRPAVRHQRGQQA
jgi:hypothetical protein